DCFARHHHRCCNPVVRLAPARRQRMSDPPSTPPPLPPPFNSKLPPPPPPNHALGWFLAISGGILLFLTLGCILAISEGNPFSEDGTLALVCGSPTLLLGGLFLWLGTRRLKR